MTIAIALKTPEAVIFGCDSTTTVTVGQQRQVLQLFNSAQKLFEIGPANNCFIPGESFSGMFMTYGDGSFGPITWRDLVNRFFVSRAKSLQPADNVTQSFLEFAKEEWRTLQMAGKVSPNAGLPQAGAMIAGVTSGSVEIQSGAIEFDSQKVKELTLGELEFNGMPETVLRIVNGYDPLLQSELLQAGVSPADFADCAKKCSITPLIEHMPLRDAIDFVHFLVYSTVKLNRYRGGPVMVGGSIEIATLTADRGFRWIMHKPLNESIGVTANHHFR